MQVRVYLTGRMAVETPVGIADEAQFPGRQGRLAFAFLGLSAQRPVARDTLADAIWGLEQPAAWESALKSIMSKLRSLLKMVGLSDAIGSVSGCYQLRLPVESWIDLEACVRAVDVAEGAIRRHVIDEAWSEATVATAIARRPLLPGEDAPWIDDVRLRLTATHVRALEVLAQVWLQRRNAPLAMAASAEAVGLEPFRESGYRLLMEAHALAGNRAEAIRTYDRCSASPRRRSRRRTRSRDDRAARSVSTLGRLRVPSVRKRLRSRSPTSSDQPHWPLSLATKGGAKSCGNTTTSHTRVSKPPAGRSSNILATDSFSRSPVRARRSTRSTNFVADSRRASSNLPSRFAPACTPENRSRTTRISSGCK